MKRRRHEDPLTTSVNETIRRVSNWEDATEGKFTIEVSTTTGRDFVVLHIGKVDEVRGRDLAILVREVPHIVKCHFDFETQAICFRFETTEKKFRAICEDDTALINNEVTRLSRQGVEDSATDLRCLAHYIVAVKKTCSLVQQETVRFSTTTSPGIMTLTVKHLAMPDIRLIEQLCTVSGNVKDLDMVVFLSPADMQCVRIRVRKAKKTVNV
jgi:hypothetical protein